jgi:MSHA biogenesis protein MshE
MARPEKIRLGDLLVQQKLISMDQLQFALEQQKRSGRKLGRVLVDNGFVSEDQISEAIAKQLSIPYINLKYYRSRAGSLPPKTVHGVSAQSRWRSATARC